MKIVRLLALASLFVSFVPSTFAFEYVENFATNPSSDGWETFGDTNLFQWNSTNQDLQVTWDSTQNNSYFFHPLDFAVTANDDFSISFDLNLADIASDPEPGKTGPMELGFEFLDLAAAYAEVDWPSRVEIDSRYFRPTEVDFLQGDSSKARSLLDWRPTIGFEDLVMSMVQNDLELARQEQTLIRGGHNVVQRVSVAYA